MAECDQTPRDDKGRALKRMLWTFMFVILGLYLGWALLMFFVQDHLVFPRWALDQAFLSEAPAGFEEWSITTDEGRVHAWYLAGSGCTEDAPGGVVVMLHGNGMYIDRWIAEASAFAAMGWNVLLPEFRGYGRAEGTPSQDHLRSDVVAFIDQLDGRSGVDPDRLVYYGRSIGGALAAQVALDRPPAGLVLQTPPASISALAWRYGVPPFLVRSPFDTIDALERLGPIPTLLIEHDADEVIPASHPARIMEVAPHARHLVLEGRHNGLASSTEDQRFMDEMGVFLELIRADGR